MSTTTSAKRQDAAILLVTHDHRILDVADRVLALEDGRVVSVGDPPTHPPPQRPLT